MSAAIDLWRIALKKEESAPCQRVCKNAEWALVFVGPKGAGKTTLISKLMNNTVVRPSTSLEYNYLRSSHTLSAEEHTVTHIWELGGDSNVDLLELVVRESSLPRLVLVFVADLANLPRSWDLLDSVMESLHDHVVRLRESESSGAFVRQCDVAHSIHSTPPGIKIVVIAMKYDLFQMLPSNTRDTACRALRFLALLHGADLYFVSSKIDTLLRRGVEVLLNMRRDPARQERQLEFGPDRPLAIAAGQDSFEAVGSPKTPGVGSPDPMWHGSSLSLQERWKEAIGKVSSCGEESGQPFHRPELLDFPEKTVDDARALRDKELDRYRKSRVASVRGNETARISGGLGFLGARAFSSFSIL